MTLPPATLRLLASPTPHALERYRLYYPEATEDDLLAAMARSVRVEPSIARRLTGFACEASSEKRWATRLLHPERTGMFVWLRNAGSVLSFTRFERSQHDLAVRLYGAGEEPASTVPWSGQGNAPREVVGPSCGVLTGLLQPGRVYLSSGVATLIGGSHRAYHWSSRVQWRTPTQTEIEDYGKSYGRKKMDTASIAEHEGRVVLAFHEHNSTRIMLGSGKE